MSARSLSYAQAARCETAREPVCKCRCGGALHGRGRAAPDVPTVEYFEGLPAEDPHHLTSAAERAARQKRTRERARLEKWAGAYGETALYFIRHGDAEWAGFKARLAAREGLRAQEIES